jgi:hypothetical protein
MPHRATKKLYTQGKVAERRHHGALYVQSLLLDAERKSIEPLPRRARRRIADLNQVFFHAAAHQ